MPKIEKDKIRMNHIPLLEGESPDPLADRTGGGKRLPYMPPPQESAVGMAIPPSGKGCLPDGSVTLHNLGNEIK